MQNGLTGKNKEKKSFTDIIAWLSPGNGENKQSSTPKNPENKEGEQNWLSGLMTMAGVLTGNSGQIAATFANDPATEATLRTPLDAQTAESIAQLSGDDKKRYDVLKDQMAMLTGGLDLRYGSAGGRAKKEIPYILAKHLDPMLPTEKGGDAKLGALMTFGPSSMMAAGKKFIGVVGEAFSEAGAAFTSKKNEGIFSQLGAFATTLGSGLWEKLSKTDWKAASLEGAEEKFGEILKNIRQDFKQRGYGEPLITMVNNFMVDYASAEAKKGGATLDLNQFKIEATTPAAPAPVLTAPTVPVQTIDAKQPENPFEAMIATLSGLIPGQQQGQEAATASTPPPTPAVESGSVAQTPSPSPAG